MAISDLTPGNYLCPEGEERSYHCRIEVKKFDADTGGRLSRPVLQKFDPKFFEGFGLHHLRQQGYTVDVLHDPRKWADEHREAEQAEAERRRAEAARAEAERRESERAALKAEILEELKASGVIPATNVKKGKEQ